MLGDLAYWIPDEEEAWCKADLVSLDNESKEVKVKDPKKEDNILTFKQGEVHPFDVSHQLNGQDLCKMNDLHEAPLLNLLKRRYMEDEIYTTAGSLILVSVNPYKAIPGLYDTPLRYFDLPEGDEALSDVTLPPHVYKVANQTLHSMLSYKEGAQASTAHNFGERLMNQSIIVSGESGAGKTEASKKVMNFLVQANIELVKPLEEGGEAVQAGRRGSVNMKNDALGMVAHKIQEEILGSNFIFESFGNAKTVRNDNSSRFGKYIKLQYSGQDLLVSAYTDTFLLEKSRLLAVAQGESNYHVLYQLVAAAANGSLPAELTEKLRIGASSAEEGFKRFNILTAPDGECYWKSDESGQEFNLLSLSESLNATGFSAEEQENLWSLLAVILHLGNVELSGGEDGEKTKMSCTSMPTGEMAKLLGLEETTFQEKMTIQLVKIRGRSSIATKQLNRKETRNNVNAYIKMVYSSIFNYIVHKINYSHSLLSSMAKLKAEKFIGILDIFGFEIMKKNSFEQLCINYANERLQQHFNKNVFVKEKEEYHSQGLDATFITYADNQDVIDLLISKPNGMFTIMNDLAKINKTDDGIFLKNTQKAHVPDRGQPPPALGTPSARYEMPTTTKHIEFRVRHFAGTVVYTVGGPEEAEASFLMKNNDSLQEGLEQTVILSKNKFFNNVGGLEIGMEGIGEMGEPGFVPKFANTGMNAPEEKESEDEVARRSVHKQMAAATTVSTTFMTQVEDLMRVLRETEPHYIKCMKPNTKKATCTYDGQLMLQQLRYSGVLEVVRIRREGYPWNATFSSFYATFDLLSVFKQLREGWPQPQVLKKEADCEEKSKSYALQLLETHFTTEEEKALYAVGNTRIYMKEAGFARLQLEITRILDRVASVIQKHFRRRAAMKWYATTRKWVLLHQSLARGKLGRVTFKLQLEVHKAELARIAAEKAAEQERLRLEEEERRRLEEERLRQEAIEKAKREAEEAEIARLEAEKEAARIAEEERQRKIREEEEERQRKAAEEERARLQAIEDEKQGRIDYHLACMKGDYETVVRMTGENPALTRSVHPDDTTLKRLPLAKAASARHLKLLQFFNPSPADVFKTDSAGMNALHAACVGCKLPEGETAVSGGHTQLLPCMQYLLRAASDYPLEEAFTVLAVCGPRDVGKQDRTVMGAQKQRQGPTGAIMKEGYLSKKHESFFSTTDASKKNAWVTRWVRLTDEAIYYFKEEEDAQREMPRDTISFTKNMGKMNVEYYKAYGGMPAVKITFSQGSGIKGRTVLNLRANDQREMDEWAKPLKQLSGMMNGDFQPDATIVKMDRLSAFESKSLLYSKTAKGDSAINLLARGLPTIVGEGAGKDAQDTSTSLVTAMAWLVSAGCFVDERGSSQPDGAPSPRGAGTGATAFEIATHHGNLHAGLALCKLGAMATPAVTEYLKAAINKGVITRQQDAGERIRGLDYLFRQSLATGHKKPIPARHKALTYYQRELYIPGYSYLSIHFQRMSLTNSLQVWTTHTDPEARYQPCLKVNLLDRQDSLVEHYSVLSVPVVQHRPLEMSEQAAKGLPAEQRYIWWGKSAHVETPLDYLPDGCHFTFEYRKDLNSLTNGVSVEAVGRFTLNFAHLKTSGNAVRVPLVKQGSTTECGYMECEVVISTLR